MFGSFLKRCSYSNLFLTKIENIVVRDYILFLLKVEKKLNKIKSLRGNDCKKSEYEFNHIPQRYKRKDLLL